MPAGRPTVEDDKSLFVEKLKEENGTAGNVRLRRLLQWSEDRYWRTHTDLFNEGHILRGKGKGGSVVLAAEALPPIDDSDINTPQSEATSTFQQNGPSSILEKTYTSQPRKL